GGASGGTGGASAGTGGASAGPGGASGSTGGTGGASGGTGGTGGGPTDPYAAARQACVDGINQYRATLGLAPYARWTSAEACADS
ncbi:MAG: hypothetical protein OZ921_05255, partial [Sorangiineae bacterium]|nr:hypothetical protein [Sorangiineae bacterium]